MKRKNGEGMGPRLLRAIAILVMSVLTDSGWTEEKKAEPGRELWTNTYIVPPNIHRRLEERAEEMKREREERRQNVEGIKERLARCGIQFPEGASVIYNPSSSTLIFRNTKQQIAILEPLIESMIPAEKQIYVVIREIRYEPDALRKEVGDREGMDWLFWEPSRRVTRDLPEGSTAAVSVSSVDELLEVMSQPPVPPPPKLKWADERGIAAMFTDTQIQVVYRALSELKEVDLLKPPTFVLRSEQAGLSQVDKKRWGVAAVIGEDEFGANETTIKLSLYLPREGEVLFSANDKTRKPTARVSLPNGQTVAFRDRIGEDELRIVFVTATIVDPAGLKIKPKPNKAAPAEAKPAAEIEKEREAIRAVDRIGLRGYDKLVAGDFKGAVADFGEALRKLPKNLKDETRRNAFQTQLKKARTGLESLKVKGNGTGTGK